MAVIEPTAGFDDIPLLEDSDAAQGRKNGDSVAVGQLENMNKQALALKNNIEALRTGATRGPRNCVLSGKIDGSYLPDFGNFASNILTITGAATPLILSFANGQSDFGSTDEVVVLTSALTVDYAAAAITDPCLVFILWDGAALTLVNLEAAYGNLQYHSQPSPPAFISADQFWYDSIHNKMYREVAAAWVAVKAIFLGGCDPVATAFDSKPFGIPAFNYEAPVGSVQVWHDITAIPAGFKQCNGATLTVVFYPELFNVIGYDYGGATDSFDLPDFTGETLNTIAIKYIIKVY